MNSSSSRRVAPTGAMTRPGLAASRLSVTTRTEVPRLCTIKEIAAEAGVSSTTVHRVLHGEMMVRRQTYKRVIAAIRRLNAERLALFASAAHGDLI